MSRLTHAATLLAGLLLVGTCGADQPAPRVRMTTSVGDFVVELAPQRAPATVENFLSYVRAGFYDGTIFHRVIDNFMIQGGGFGPDFERKETGQPVRNEADNGLKNVRGSVAMARTEDPHSATAQFFVNVADNDALDHQSKTPRGWGYAVFGKVVEGMDVVDRIKSVATGARGRYRDVPVENIVIESARVVEP